MPSRLKVLSLVALCWLAASWMFIRIAPAMGAGSAALCDPLAARSSGAAPRPRARQSARRPLKIDFSGGRETSPRLRMVLLDADNAVFAGLALAADDGRCLVVHIPAALDIRSGGPTP